MEELAEYLRQVESIEAVAKGKAVAAMRETGASWRAIAKATGKPHATLRFWYMRYQEGMAPSAE